MTEIQTYFDIAMCVLWVVTYSLALIISIKSKQLAISPFFILAVFPFEAATLVRFIIKYTLFNYVVFSYLIWVTLEISIVILAMNIHQIVHKLAYVFSLVIISIIVGVCLEIDNDLSLHISYLLTLVGCILWLGYLLKANLRINLPIIIMLFSKFLANLIAVPVYVFAGTILDTVTSVLLPIVDLATIIICFSIRKKRV